MRLPSSQLQWPKSPYSFESRNLQLIIQYNLNLVAYKGSPEVKQTNKGLLSVSQKQLNCIEAISLNIVETGLLLGKQSRNAGFWQINAICYEQHVDGSSEGENDLHLVFAFIWEYSEVDEIYGVGVMQNVLIYIGFVIKMQLAGQKTLSMVKKRGQGAKAEFIRMHLAVYPFEVEFLNPVNYRTAFYFQKNFQIIGCINHSLPPARKNTKVPLTDIKNIINFRLHSEHNIVYKWSVYRRADNGEEEYLDTCTLNLREAVNSFVGNQKNYNSHSHSSVIEMGLLNKEMRLKFPKIGAILIFMLYVASDIREIRQHVQTNLINKIEEEENMPQATTLLKTDSGNLQPNSNMKKTSNQSIYKIKSSSDPILGSSSLNNKQNQSFNDKARQQSDKIKEDPPSNRQQPEKLNEQAPNKAQNGDLENLIMSFDVNGSLNQPIKAYTRKVPGDKNENIPQERVQQNLNQDIFKEDFQTSSRPKRSSPIQEEIQAEEKPTDGRDYGMLKLQSDQGRIRQEQIDRKLQLQQLQAIEEQKPSREYTINETNISPVKKKNSKSKITTSNNSIKQQNQTELQATPSKINFKKLGVIFFLSIFLFIAAATLSKKINRKKRAPKSAR